MTEGVTAVSRIRGVAAVYLSAVLVFTIGCDGPSLEKKQPRNLISLKGTFLTESPDEIEFPVKVLFAIDCSLSMGDEELGTEVGSDPHFLRIEAVRNFIGEYNSNENTSFEIILWSSNVFEWTRRVDGGRGFTKDPVELNRVLDSAYNDTTTDYLGTLSDIHEDIRADINLSSEESRVRTKYIVIFLSDGLSNANGVTQPDSAIWNSVDNIAEMAEENGVGGFNLHTFLLLGMFGPGDSGDAARAHAENTLRGMAERGNGQFRLFENAEAIDFVNIVDMRLTVEYKIKYLVAYNYNARPGLELVYVDSDGDGLPDYEETLYGSDPYLKDTDGDGLGDFFEVKMSSPGHELDPTTRDSPCDQIPGGIYPDSDSDGLTDCEEYVKGTNRRVADTDADGIPDGIEFLAGANPLEDLVTKDSDFDGLSDWLEVQKHTNMTSNDPKIRQRYAYNYDLRDMGLVQINQGTDMESYVRRYSFDISNIDLMETALFTAADGSQWRSGDNLIRFYIAQVPEDRPNVPPLFRMAERLVNTSQAGEEIILTPADFVLIQ